LGFWGEIFTFFSRVCGVGGGGARGRGKKHETSLSLSLPPSLSLSPSLSPSLSLSQRSQTHVPRHAVAPVHGAHQEDPPGPAPVPRPVRAQQRQEGLRDDQRRDEVDLELPAQQRRREQRDGVGPHVDSRVVDEPCQHSPGAQDRGHPRGRSRDGVGVADVEHERREERARLAAAAPAADAQLELLGVGGPAHRAEDVVALRREAARDGGADAAGHARDDDGAVEPLQVGRGVAERVPDGGKGRRGRGGRGGGGGGVEQGVAGRRSPCGGGGGGGLVVCHLLRGGRGDRGWEGGRESWREIGGKRVRKRGRRG